MKKATSFLALAICVSKLFAQNAPPIEWQKCLGGSNWDLATSVAVTSDAGYIIGGWTLSDDSEVTGRHDGPDYWIVRLDSIGNIVWTKCLGGSNDDEASSVQQTTDKGFIVAGYSNSNDGDVSGNHGMKDYWVVKLKSSGSIVWQKSLGGSDDDIASSIQETSDGGYVVAGSSDSNDGDVTNNSGIINYWVVKLDSLGDIVWQKVIAQYGGGRDNSIQQTSDKGFITAGCSNEDYWIVKLDSLGSIVWDTSYSDYDFNWATSVRQTYDGGYAVAGYTYNFDQSNVMTIKLNPNGDFEWESFIGGNNDDGANSIIQTPDSGYVIAAYTGSTDLDVSGNHGFVDYWIVKLDQEGNIQWQQCLGGSGGDNAYSIQKTAEDGFIIAGLSTSTDGEVTGNHGEFDYWIVKLGAEEVGIENLNKDFSFKIFPNPATDLITLQLQSQINSTFSATIIFTNFLGETLFEKSSRCINGHLEETISLDAKFSSGIYFVKVSSDQQQWSAPFVVQK